MEQVTYSFGSRAERPRPFQVVLVGRDTAAKNPSYEYRRERTEFTAVEYVHRGVMDLTINGVTYRARAGNAYLLPRGCRFHVRNGTRRDWQRTWFILTGTLVEPILAALGLAHVCLLPAGAAGAAFLRLWKIAGAKHVAAETLAGVAFEVLQLLSAERRADELSLSPAVLRAKNYLDNRVEKSVEMGGLAALMGCSAAHAIRLFRNEVGRTPHAYHRDQQIERAKLLVAHSTKSIKAIAYELGFCDQYYFARAFKAAVGMTPTAYRHSA